MGRKSRLEHDPTIIRAVGGALQAGHYATVACAIAGLPQSTYYSLLERGEAIAEQVANDDHPEKARAALTITDELTLQLHETVTKSSATAEARWLRSVLEAAEPHTRQQAVKVRQSQRGTSVETVEVVSVQEPGDWRAALELLARRFPDRWGRRDQLEIADAVVRDPVAEAALTDRAVRAKVNDLLRSVSGQPESCDE
jgi:hypothetical protein